MLRTNTVSISNWEHGITTPSRRMMKRIREFLDYIPELVLKVESVSFCCANCEISETTAQRCLFEGICKSLNRSQF